MIESWSESGAAQRVIEECSNAVQNRTYLDDNVDGGKSALRPDQTT